VSAPFPKRISRPIHPRSEWAERVRWLVGDIQGCAREFDELLGAVRFDPDRDELWCLGDLIDRERGDESLAVLRLWRAARGRAILGNHEAMVLLAVSSRKKTRPRGLTRILSAPDAEELLASLRALPVLLHLASSGEGPDAWIVHAGLHPGWNDLDRLRREINDPPHDDEWLRSAAVHFATNVRCCDPGGGLSPHDGPPEDCPAGFRPWDAFYRDPALVVHGHWAARGYYRSANAMGLDSACVHGGALTAWCQEEDRIVQVAARRS
jgi:bis(5'-nucleosyl)-tetraphosphatase (symmetrical)